MQPGQDPLNNGQMAGVPTSAQRPALGLWLLATGPQTNPPIFLHTISFTHRMKAMNTTISRDTSNSKAFFYLMCARREEPRIDGWRELMKDAWGYSENTTYRLANENSEDNKRGKRECPMGENLQSKLQNLFQESHYGALGWATLGASSSQVPDDPLQSSSIPC